MRSPRTTPRSSGSSSRSPRRSASSALLMAGRRLISGRQALAVEMDMRQGLYAHLVRLSFGFYDRHQTGS